MEREFIITKDQRKCFLKELQELALQREIKGLPDHGHFDGNDLSRLMSVDGQEEQVDSFNYMRFIKRKHPELASLAVKVQRLSFEAYCTLRILEQREAELDKNKGAVLDNRYRTLDK